MSSIGQLMQPFERSELRFFGPFRLGMLGAPSALSIDARHTAQSCFRGGENLAAELRPLTLARAGTFWGAENGFARFWRYLFLSPLVVKHFAMLVWHELI